MKQENDNEAEWSNPDHWGGGLAGLYFSKKDTRWIVPKHNRWGGWTFNLAHPKGAWAFILALLAPTLFIVGLLIAHDLG